MKEFKGKVLFLDRSDINTDEIIPAKYLTENTKEALKPYLMEDLKLEGFDANNDIDDNDNYSSTNKASYNYLLSMPVRIFTNEKIKHDNQLSY